MRFQTMSLALLLLATAILPAGAVQAQARIGVVNVPRLLREAPQRQAVSQALENEFAARRRDLENQQRDLRAREEKLQREGASMGEAERRTLEKALRDGQRELARKRNEYTEDLNIRRNEELAKLQRRLYDAIVDLAKAEKYDLIVSEGVVYASTSIDITDAVLARLKKSGN